MRASIIWYFSDMADPTPAIPSYGLFGEGSGHDAPGFAHIETIADRSSLHDWEISAHRHEHGIQVLIIASGHADVTIDGANFALDPPGFIVLPAGSVHGFRFHPATQGHVLTFSQDFLTRARGASDPLRLLLTKGGHGTLPARAAARVARLAQDMLSLTQDWQSDDLLFHALAEALVRSLPAVADDAHETLDDRRLALFRHLVEIHLAEHRNLDFYARSIGCTERTLARLTQSRMGHSPLALIHRRLALEASRMLRYTNASVVQVAHALGFNDPSYFSRFYLRMTGRRPQSERA
jgi:AraC family transcriptional activator of pobA